MRAYRFVGPVCAVLAFFPLASSAKGCIEGAAVGGVAGHVAGHHGVLGAAAGCAVGHHRAKVKAKRKAAESNVSEEPRNNYRDGNTERRDEGDVNQRAR